MIVILNYGMGNPGSILNMLKKVGGEAVITNNRDDILQADGVILPGVGSFDNGMAALKELNLIDLLDKKVVIEKTPFLGVCLGMQLLFNNSDEGRAEGLGWIDGSVKKFDFSYAKDNAKLKIPHMGWNIAHTVKENSLFDGLETGARFYFVHSYYVACASSKNILSVANYGDDFTCAVCNDNIYGVQFHPEKSHRFGMTMFKNFLQIVSNAKN